MQDVDISSIAAEIAGHLLLPDNVEQARQPGVEGRFASQDIDTGDTRFFEYGDYLLESSDLDIVNGGESFVETKMTILITPQGWIKLYVGRAVHDRRDIHAVIARRLR